MESNNLTIHQWRTHPMMTPVSAVTVIRASVDAIWSVHSMDTAHRHSQHTDTVGTDTVNTLEMEL